MAAKKEKIVKDTSERWLLTYADLMNLLLIFFIILYTMSQVDQEKYEQLSKSFNSVLGSGTRSSTIGQGSGGNSLVDLPTNAPGTVIPADIEEQQFDAAKEEVKKIVEKQGLKGDVEVISEERGIKVSISDRLLFKSGSAVLEPNSRPTIGEIGEVLKQLPGNHIRVEGHTDNDPIHNSQFLSNWELSSARATNVLRLLVDKAGLDPRRISAVGYGEYTPRVPNTTAENKKKNRRVDIVILRSAFDKSEAGSANKTENSTQPTNSTNHE